MNRGEARAVAQLYRAAQLVLTIPGYRWSRDQIDRTRAVLTEAGLAVYPHLAKATGTTPDQVARELERWTAERPDRAAQEGSK